jgi:hypothetical protein
MFISTRRLPFFFASSALALGLLNPAARAQRFQSMGGGSMSNRPSSMMGMPSMTRSTFMGGFGLNSFRALAGTGRNYLSPYSAFGQGGYSGGGSGYGGYGAQSSRGSTPAQSSGAGDGYAPSSSNASTSSQQPAEKDPLASVRLSGGGLNWPVALRYLTRDGDEKELRERMDAQVDRLATRRVDQRAQSELLPGLRADVDALQKRFELQSYDMPTTRQQNADARRFLSKLKTALEPRSNTSTLSAGPK